MTSAYGATSTTKKVFAGLYLSDKRLLVTAASSSGPGMETARAPAARGARVVGSARDVAKAEAETTVVHGRRRRPLLAQLARSDEQDERRSSTLVRPTRTS
jgi:NAD(P)-dependent dehydrogenase (short-subunit alcohol dehydrogenase family)